MEIQPQSGIPDVGSPIAEIFDPGIFSANIAALRTTDPSLASFLEATPLPRGELRVIITRSGFPALIYRGRNLISSYDPVAEAERTAKQALDTNYPLVIAFGFGLGYAVPALLDAKHVENLFVYEPHIDILIAGLGIVDLTDYLTDPRLKIVTATADLFFKVPYAARMIPAIAEAVFPGYRTIFPDELNALKERINDMVRNSDIIVGTILQKDQVWFDYLVENFPKYCDLPSVGRLQNRFKGVPGILVAAGPSLDKNYHLLKEAKGKGLIVSVGTAIRKVGSLGIAPDITIALESNDILYQFEGAEHMEEGYFAASIHSFPGLFDLPFKETFCYAGHHDDDIFFMRSIDKEDGVIAAGGSVATAAFSLLYHAGCNPIIMIGQDLAYADKGKFHAEGVGRHRNNPFKKRDAEKPLTDKDLEEMSLIKVDGYYGGQVITQTNLMNYLLWFEKNGPLAMGSGREVINCTEGGAKIRGTVQMSLAEAIERYIEQPIPVDEILKKAAKPQKIDRKTGRRIFGKYLRQAKELGRLSKKELALIEKTFDLLKPLVPDEGKVDKKIVEINRLEKKITKILKGLDPIISPLINKENLVATKCFEYDDLEGVAALRQNMRQSHVLYKGIVKAADTLIDALERINKHLKGD
jgi:hypothetical protein